MTKTNRTRRVLALLLAPFLLAYTVVAFGAALVFYVLVAVAKGVAEIVSELPELCNIFDSNYLSHQNMKGPFRWWGNLYRGLPALLTRNDLRKMERKRWEEVRKNRPKAEPTETHEDRVKVEPGDERNNPYKSHHAGAGPDE